MILVIIGAQGSGKSTLARVVDDFSRERDKMCASTILVEDWVPNETTRAQAARWTLADRVILTTQQLPTVLKPAARAVFKLATVVTIAGCRSPLA